MRRRRLRLAVLMAGALLAAGCGSSSTPNAASVPVTPATSTPSVTSAPPPVTTPSTTTTTKAATTKTPTTATTPSTSTAVATPKTPTATTTTPLPAAPGGLKAAVGYSSYDDCTGVCTGSVPPSLRRPLRLPAGGACRVSAVATSVSYAGGPAVGPGPVYAAQATPFAITPFIDSSWNGARVTWVAAPSYTGPVLIRGGEVGGSGSVGFGEGHVPVDELQLLTAATKSTGEPAGAREWPSFTRLHAAGCYAYQVDGTNFSEVIVFQATG